ncbi:MAG: N-acetyltransferase [Chloroflexi bacterium HGW-Chloroflexi-4]|jgi:RimJ/RimL family protein N-acetyltransferase|nr:MAG: N-acetyltransferase [Chloroflexi bacterium HGW-Chloroflexi-4]
MTQNVTLRVLYESDLPVFFEHQDDKGAEEMVGLPSRERDDFIDHWQKVMANPSIILRTILYENEIAGYLCSFIKEADEREVGYQLGRAYWGKGIATRALQLFLPLIPCRPLYGVTPAHNIGSQKVLTRCGFVLLDEHVGLLKYKLI